MAESNNDSAFNPLAPINALAGDGWRMRFAKGAAQLIMFGTGKGVEAYLRTREVKDFADARSAVTRAAAIKAAEELVSDPDFVERAKARFTVEQLKRQDNLETVIGGAVQYLPKEAKNGQGQAETSSEPGTGADDVEHPLDEDWAAAFSRESELATSDQLRDRLSRLLAGELAERGAFPRSVIRTIAELSQHDLLLIKTLADCIVGDMLVHVEGWSESDRITAVGTLEEIGMTAGTEGLIRQYRWILDENGQHYLLIRGGKLGLLAKSSREQSIFSVNYTRLTKSAQAVIDLMGYRNEYKLMNEWGNKIKLIEGVVSVVVGVPEFQGNTLKMADPIHF